MTNSEFKTKLEKSLDFLKSELQQVRTSRATPALIEDIDVEAYGTIMKLKELGSITIMDPHNLVVSSWDKSVMPAIAKAIRESDVKLSPVAEPDRIRVPIPPLTEDRRKEFVRVVSTKMEECKNSMRSIRQDAMKDIDKSFTDKLIGEDDKFRQKEEIERIMKEFSGKVETLGESKKDELMTI